MTDMDPIEIMAPYFASKEGEKHPGDVRARTVIAALDAAGFVIVPKDPTQAMLDAGSKALSNPRDPICTCNADAVWYAMAFAGAANPE